MRAKSGSTEPEGSRFNFLPGHNVTMGGGAWFKGKLPKLFRAPRSQDVVNITCTTDGHVSPCEQEPQNVIISLEQHIEEQHFHEASKLLIEREERLFGETTEAEGHKHHEEEVNSLAADYRVLESRILQILQQSLSLNMGEVSTKALTSAVKAIYQEEKQDQLWKQRDRNPPAWRPSSWKGLHDATLCSLIEERMDNLTSPSVNEVQQSFIKMHVFSMGRQLKEDLLFVVEVVKTCYPPETDICDFYARQYHKSFSARLRKIADFGLEDTDSTFLLSWVNNHYPGLLQKMDGEINTRALGKLLPKELLEPLVEQYLDKQKSELMSYISCILEEAKQKWVNGEEPTREDGCYVSPVAYDIIQFTSGMVISAEKIVGDLHKAHSITCMLTDLMQSFKIFQDEVIKKDKPNSRAMIKAHLGCVDQFSHVLNTKGHLFLEDVWKNCLSILTDMKKGAHMYLLSPVHETLRPQYRMLGTRDWLNKPLFEGLLDNIQTEIQEIQGLKQSCHQELISQFHQEVTVEYVRRLLKGQVKLKNRELQHKAYTTVKDNAESLHNLFNRMGSEEEWLKEILTAMAEVLKLQELPAIQMQVASLGSAFPDLSEKHVSALLKLKTNLSRADRKTVKATLSDALREKSADDVRLFFSRVQVK